MQVYEMETDVRLEDAVREARRTEAHAAGIAALFDKAKIG